MALADAEPPAEFDDDPRLGRPGPEGQARPCGPTPTPAPTPTDAREFGAEGIGLCRTEHMFLGEDRLPIVRAMILADTPEEEAAALEELRVAQKADFLEILEAMDGLPVTVRLLDPPLHEFLPSVEELLVQAGARRASTPRRPTLLAAARVLARAEPDARHPRRAPRRAEARPLRHAGAGADGGGRRAARRRRQARSSRS